MGVIRTDEWLEKDFYQPGKVCELLLNHFEGEEDPDIIYKYLLNFGMYRPGRKSWNTFESLKSAKVWEKIAGIYKEYRTKWNGPEIPIFIFPLDHSNVRLMREGKGKSGVSFKDKLFLFLTQKEDDKEVEALFVHEYHHACRMNSQKKSPQDYTLLDSIILEGLAEHAVVQNCGDEYAADWSRRYTKDELSKYWKKDLSENLSLKRDERLHDQLLFGLGSTPKLLGYAMGYEIVKQYMKREKFSDKASFIITSDKFINSLKF
ncbi:MAG TPA: hypothetical protein DCR24_13650 [Bacillus bacterium]|nr:hypothetical protein [Bacillus sp. (in: firmicutes)]